MNKISEAWHQPFKKKVKHGINISNTSPILEAEIFTNSLVIEAHEMTSAGSFIP